MEANHVAPFFAEKEPPVKVFVTGASGFIGRHTCRALQNAGHSVVGLVRQSPAEETSAYIPGVEYVLGDVVRTPPDRLAEIMEGCQAVVHLVGLITEVRGRGQTFEAVHVGGTRNALVSARRAGAARHRFLYLSAIGAAPEARSDYSRTKALAERAVHDSELPCTILRPSVVLGPGALFLAQTEALIRRPPLSPFPLPFVPVPGPGANLFQPVFIDDLTHCIVTALSEEDQTDRTQGTFELGGADQVTFNTLIESVQRHLGQQKRLLHIPRPLLFSAAAVLESILPHPPVTTDQLIYLAQDSVCDNAAVQAAFGVNPLPFENTLARCYAARSTEAS